MNTITQYRPAFIELSVEKETAAFDTLEQLMAIPWVKGFSMLPAFHQFSIADNTLIAEYRGGREWWVCGFLKDQDVGLPKWNRGIYEVWNNGKAEDISGELVVSSCCNYVALRDGRMLPKRISKAPKLEVPRLSLKQGTDSQPRMVSLCECANWARAVNLKYLTNHHENCPHYNDSLMDVWKITVDGVSCYVDNEQDARETAGDEQRDGITVTKEKMHREVFEHLPEFEGF